MKQFLFVILTLTSTTLLGQPPVFLDKNNVSALILDNGSLFQDTTSGQAGYEIPKGSGNTSIYSSSFWFGALDSNGQLLVSAQNFGNTGGQDFYAGPYSTNASYLDPGYIAQYVPAIWKVTRIEVDDHVQEYLAQGTVSNPSNSILTWPAHGDPALGTSQNLAPFVDQNNDGVYDPYGGDYPDIKGCESTYIIFNDNAGPSNGSGAQSLGIEVHILLYQYASTDFLNDITFMDMRAINRGTNTLFDFASACYTDGDIGNYSDDYVGCDVDRNLTYFYNGDNFDEDNAGGIGYGENPPSVGVMYLNQTMSHSGYYTNGSSPALSDPSNGVAFWNYMNGLWADGTPWVYGGTGYPGSMGSTAIPSDFLFPGDSDPTFSGTGGVDPGFAWSETNIDGTSIANPTGDRRVFMSSQHGDLTPNNEISIDFAIVYGRDTSLNSFQNIDVMKNIADSVQAFYDAGFDECNDPFANSVALDAPVFNLYPNPSNGIIQIEMKNGQANYSVEIQDALGRSVFTKSNLNGQAEIVLNEPSGIYFVTIRSNDHYITKKLLIE